MGRWRDKVGIFPSTCFRLTSYLVCGLKISMDSNDPNRNDSRCDSQPLIGGSIMPLPPGMDLDQEIDPSLSEQLEDGNASNTNQLLDSLNPDKERYASPALVLNSPSNTCRKRRNWNPKQIMSLMPSKVIVTIAFFIILALLICPTIVISKLSLLSDSIVIGGKFNQPTAKAIDFCWSFGISPLLYWALDAYFFSIGRVTMVNEQSKHATSLQSLAEASGTDSGTYNYFKLHRLLFRSTQRMKLFAVLAVCSAIDAGTLSNAIAYEATTILDGSSNTRVQLRYLNWDPVVPWGTLPPENLGFSDPQQQLNFSSEAVAMLTKIAYQNATTLLESDGTYIGINATQGSINSLDSSIGLLQNVPAYKPDIECSAAVASYVEVRGTIFGSRITTYFNRSAFGPSGVPKYDSYLTMPPDSIPEGVRSMGANLWFVGFTPDNSIAHLGALRKYLRAAAPSLSTPYGDISCKYFNMSGHPGWTGGSALDEPCLYGIQCKILRQTGTIDYRRESNGSWTKIPVMFNSERTVSPILMSFWQLVLNFQVPILYMNQGLGSAFWNSAWMRDCKSTNESESCTNYTVLAANLLYGASEMERMTLEGLNLNLAGQTGLFEVKAASNNLVYQITYVPVLLYAAVLATLCAVIISFLMVAYSWQSKSFKEWRKVDTLRLLVDAVYGLEDEWVRDIQEKENGELKDWAKEFPVRYVRQRDLNGDVRISLIRRRYLTPSIVSSVNEALFDPK
jgi:hypothetical protein